MIVIPAIDIKNGRCVRLKQGRMEDETVYSLDPVDIARRWESMGAELIHIVDLNAAVEGGPRNFSVVSKILDSINTPVQVGGGIRDLGTAEKYLSSEGVKRVIIGTAAIEDEEFLVDLLKRYPDRVAVGIDAKHGKVAIKGWVSVTDMDVAELAVRLKGLGVKCFVYTDIARDGMLTGPNVVATKRLMEEVGLPVIASGGVSSVEDIVAIRKIGAAGVITGKALYSGGLDLREAIEAAR